MIILELIGRKKFQEISGLSDEEYELLIKNAYISPYSEEDNKSYFFENEAEFTKAKKDEWLREARDMEEWAKENPELDAFQQEEEIDNDNFDSDYIELDRDREVYEEYETRQYGDTQKVVTNDDVTEDDLQTIYDVLGLSMDPDQEDIKDSANQKKNKNTKNHLKKHRQHITQTAMEESLDPNKGRIQIKLLKDITGDKQIFLQIFLISRIMIRSRKYFKNYMIRFINKINRS